jgi:NAD(P)H dehydrogenase (quinone)
MSRLLVTGGSGQLGRLVIERLLDLVPASQIVALLRNPDAAGDLAASGVEVRLGDYSQPQTLDAAFAGIGRALLISSNALGQRVAQHRHVIEAARRAKVGLLAYTSVLHADRSPLGLAAEHLETESILRASGVPFVLLRNGWYTENYTAAIPAALAHNALLGSAGEGKIASAARADYAAAAAAVLTGNRDWNGQVLELAGDAAYTLPQLAAEITQQSGRQVAYVNLPEAEYRAALIGAGLPAEIAALLADSDTGAAAGALFNDSHQLSALIGRPTTPMPQSVAAALAVHP